MRLFIVMDKGYGRMYIVRADNKYHARRRIRDKQLAEMSNEDRERLGYVVVEMSNFGVCELKTDEIDLVEVEPTWVSML